MKTIQVYNEFGTELITYELANFGERLVARILDTLIIFIPSAIVPIIPSWLYWSLMQSGERNATVGQRAMKIKVIDTNGDIVTFGQTTGRYFASILSGIVLFIGFFMMLFTKNSQCLHDLICNTAVVKEIPIEVGDDFGRHLVDVELRS